MTPALIVSIIALTLSIVSLSWQVWSWRRSGPVVTVKTGHAYPTCGSQVGEHHIYVRAHNSGRTPVQVTSWSLEAPGKRSIVQVRPVSFSTPLPHTLPNGAEAQWFMLGDALDAQCAEMGVRVEDLRAVVNLGTGQAARARRKGV